MRGDRIKNVRDPERGQGPFEDGASAAGRKGAKGTRRGKKKRHGLSRDAASAAVTSQPGSAEAAGRPPEQFQQKREAVLHQELRSGQETGQFQQKRDAAVRDVAPAPDGAAAGPVRKRKRRRRSKGAGDRHAAQAAAVATQARAADEPSAPARKHKHGSRGKSGHPLRAPVPVHMPSPPSLRPNAFSGNAAARKAVRGDAERDSAPRHPGRDGEHASDDLYAALDLGTNNCRLLIAQPTRPGQFRVVDAFSRIVRLGEGLGTSGRLSDAAMERAVEALRVCSVKLKSRAIRRARLIATEACRAAENGEDFLSRVTEETGLRLEIINRETEARLAVSGCSSLVGRDARSVVLFDIGGGSSEIAVLKIGENRSPRLANHITHWTSLPVGVVTLSERHGGRDVSPVVFEAMVTEVEGMLGRFDCPPLDTLSATDDFYLIGTSGTVTTLAGVHLDLPRYDRRRVDGLWLSNAEVSEMQARLLSWDFAGRASNPCIGPDRADLVLAGCAILEAIRRRWPSKRMRVADRGLREGVLTDMMADDGVWRRNRPRRPSRNSRER